MIYWLGSFGHGTGEASLAGSRDDGSERLGCANRVREMHYENLGGAGALGTRADKWFKLGPTLGLKLAVSSKTIAAEFELGLASSFIVFA